MNKSSPQQQDHAKPVTLITQTGSAVCVHRALPAPGNPAGVTQNAAGKSKRLTSTQTNTLFSCKCQQ